MSRLLDTDICIAIMRGRPGQARERLVTCRDPVVISPIVLFELIVGVEKSADPAFEAARLKTFLTHFTVITFDSSDALSAARVRARLERRGQRIGAYDTLLAGQALARSLILVTGNRGEFGRVDGLVVESWLE